MILLYSTNCPRCRVLELKLKQTGIEYEICTDEDLMIANGFTSAPVLEVDGQTMQFEDAIKWITERN